MATYLIGDIQGCYTPLRRALDLVRFDAARDQLWSVGDIVNRGGDDLRVVQLLRSLGASFRCVLGNHDLHFLAVAYGARALKRSDTLSPLLEAPERDTIVEWFRSFPLAFYEKGVLLVHAGVPPDWTLEQTLARAAEVEALVRGPHIAEFLKNMYGDKPTRFEEAQTGYTRSRTITNALTRLRFCDPQGNLDFENKLGPESAPPGMLPWFAFSERVLKNTQIAFGHWAFLNGQVSDPQLYALDTGCVWGRQLTLLRLDDAQRFSCDCTRTS